MQCPPRSTSRGQLAHSCRGFSLLSFLVSYGKRTHARVTQSSSTLMHTNMRADKHRERRTSSETDGDGQTHSIDQGSNDKGGRKGDSERGCSGFTEKHRSDMKKGRRRQNTKKRGKTSKKEGVTDTKRERRDDDRSTTTYTVLKYMNATRARTSTANSRQRSENAVQSEETENGERAAAEAERSVRERELWIVKTSIPHIHLHSLPDTCTHASAQLLHLGGAHKHALALGARKVLLLVNERGAVIGALVAL